MAGSNDEKRAKPSVERIYPETIRFKCPSRGWVDQKVMVKRYASQKVEHIAFVDETVEELLRGYSEDDDEDQ